MPQITIDVMKLGNKLCFIVLTLFLAAICAAASAQDSAVQLVTQVSSGVQEQQRLMPDFVATEDVTAQTIENGRLIHERRVLSELQALREDGKPEPQEQRRVLSATEDGKPQIRAKYALPIGVRGGFAGDAPRYFSAESLVCFDFEIERRDQLRGRSAVVLAIRRKNSPPANAVCTSASKAGATAWIDAETARVLRLELGQMKQLDYSVPFGRENGTYLFAPVIEYGEIEIAGHSYWVPIEKRVDFVKENGKVTYKYVVRYSNFHKFMSTSRIVRVENSDK